MARKRFSPEQIIGMLRDLAQQNTPISIKLIWGIIWKMNRQVIT